MRQISIDQLGNDGSWLFSYPKTRPPFVDQTLVMGSGNLVTWGKRRISANLTLYVATTGNNATADGTLAKPFLTAIAALDWARYNIDFCGYDLILQFADGTYNGFSVNNYPTAVQIIGNASNSSAVKFNFGTSTSCFIVSNSFCSISYVEINAQYSASSGLYAISVSRSVLNLTSVNFNALTGTSTALFHCYSFRSQINIYGGQIKGGAYSAFVSTGQSYIIFHTPVSIANSGFSYFLQITEGSVVYVYTAFSGSTTGSQALIQYNSYLKGIGNMPSGLTAAVINNGGYSS